jgi:amino acid adenylation domain-containing protein
LATEEARQPFDLVSGPLVRAMLLQLADDTHILLLIIHHISYDGWSAGILLHELTTFYEAFQGGRPAPLAELPIQYADFAVWQREWLQGDRLAEQLAYWKPRLTNVPTLQLPTDRPRPRLQSYRGAAESARIPRSLLEELKALSQREKTSLFVTLLAAFKALLLRYTGQADIAIGTLIAGRHRSETEGLIGFFVNTLVMHTDLSGDPSFLAALRRVRESYLGAHAHQDVPFEKLVDEVHPQRDLSRNPLFQVLFVLQNAPLSQRTLPGLALSTIELDTGTAKFDLALFAAEGEQGLTLSIEYNTDLFEVATIQRILAHFQTLVAGILDNPQACLSALPLLTPAEQDQILHIWNATQAPYPRGACIHHLIATQASQTPDAVAVVCEGQSLTYEVLQQRANILAYFLQQQGVRPGVLVGLCMERSLDMIVSLLAILKAGGAYVPLDPAYPQERLDFMLQDAQVPLLLTQADLRREIGTGARIICVDTERETIAQTSPAQEGAWVSQPPICFSSPDDLAYVIYTSGSTGKPKGVQIPHRAVVNFLWSMRHRPGLTAQDTLLAVTSLSFDIAGLELYLPLTVGARLVIASREVASSGERLVEALDQSGATVMQPTPATWRLLLGVGWSGIPHLTILCGGEALSPDLADQLLPRCAALWNMYGPTESTVWSSIHRVEAQPGPVPLGHPIANTQLYLLDAHLQPVPIGVPGELYIGGAGLSVGYLARPELTAERFIPDPFSAQSGACLYKTGDLARYRPDGTSEFLGRVDHQVKVRGFRIELGEIEAVLERHPLVQQAAVIAWEDTPGNGAAAPGDKRLAAYIVPAPADTRTGQNLDQQLPQDLVRDLRHYLKGQLPDYMVPPAFVVLETLPLTPNGKVDRRALPPPERTRVELRATFVAPRTTEQALAEIWS